VGDIIEYFSDKFKLSTSKPVETIVALLRQAVFEGTPLHLAGHSQGALMISRALEIVRDEWMALNHGSKDDAAKAFEHIRVETYGGGAYNYIDGPKYVHVHNSLDPVSQFLGIGALGGLFSWAAKPGRDACVYKITDVNTDLKASKGVGAPSIVDKLVHGPQAIYFRYRVSFDEARRGEFPLKIDKKGSKE
jgi:hypothetical protein